MACRGQIGIGFLFVLLTPAAMSDCPASSSPAGRLNEARAGHTATLLPDGKVLVVGGLNSIDRLKSAELFDPATGLWILTGPLKTRRNAHTATLLPDGKVLVTGGNTTGYQPLRTSELYDPATGRWNETGELINPRAYHTSTLLPDGTVLVAGGGNDTNQSTLASAELYHPATGTWTETGRLLTPRAFHTATLLLDGTVLAAGGGVDSSRTNNYSSAELYHPASGLWKPTGELTRKRSHFTATLLPDGRVLAAGGVNASEVDDATSTAELYDPATGRWISTKSMVTGRYGHSATLLRNGSVLVAGGSSGLQDLSSTEIYSPASDVWTASFPMLEARLLHTATSLGDGAVLIAGGVELGIPRWLASTLLICAGDGWSISFTHVNQLPGGAMAFGFAASPDAGFSVYGSADIAAPVSLWTPLGAPWQVAPGHFEFTDAQGTGQQRFYRVASPPAER